MTISKLSLLNSALFICGENVFTAADDGSQEWNVVSASYESGLRMLLADHNWKFAKTMDEVLDRDDPNDPAWQDAYERPGAAVHITRVMDTDGNVIEWAIFGDMIHVNKDDGILVESIQDKSPSVWPNFFTQVMERFVFAGIYRGIKHDREGARESEADGMKLLSRARPRIDQEEPVSARHVSSLGAARRRRRG